MHNSMSIERIVAASLLSSLSSTSSTSVPSKSMTATVSPPPSSSSTTTTTTTTAAAAAAAAISATFSGLCQWLNGTNRSTFITMRKFEYKYFYWILISLNIFIALAYCDDDIISPTTTQPIPQKRSGGGGGGGGGGDGREGRGGGGGNGGSSVSSTGVLDIKDHCNKTVEIYEEISSPELTHLNRNRPLLCTYRFRSFRGAPRDWVLRIRFKKFKVGNILNATHCDGGYLQIVDGNAKTDISNRRDPGMFCGEAEQPQTFISETSYVKIIFFAENYTDQTYFSFDSRAEQQIEVFLRYGQHPELYPSRRGEAVQGSYCEREFRDCRLQTCYVQSPAYPGLYPRALNCRYRLHTRQPFIKLYLQNEHFSVDGQRCENIMTCPMREIGSGSIHCPYDYLAVYDGRDEHAPLIGKFCGVGKFPFSIIGTSQHMFVEFVSSPAGPLLNTGFHFNVGNWPGHVDTAGTRTGVCDWLLSSDALKDSNASEGIFLSIAHWYPPNTTCSYHIQGNEGEVVRLYFPSFRINRIEAPIQKIDMDCAESLTIYDSSRPDPSRIIKTFCDTFSRPMEKIDFVSTGRSLYVRFNSRTGSYSGSSLYYWAHYDFFNNTKFGEPIANTICDEVFYAWKHSHGHVRSPVNTLIFKRATGTDLRCQYKFITDKRLYARVLVEVTSVTFKELPYNMNSCTRCHEERVDKLIIWEEREKSQEPLACFCDDIPRPVRIISSGEQMNLEMIIQGQHSQTSYFKNHSPLFQANYEFAHGPLCGPSHFGPSADGELSFPYRNQVNYYRPSTYHGHDVQHGKREKCIWELRVAGERDLWMHLDKAEFTDKSCDLARIEVYLAGRLEPRFIICPENVSLAHGLPILSAAELGAVDEHEPLPVLIQYTGDSTPGRNSFRLLWTELFHLPRNSEGNLARSYLKDSDCDFKCPGNTTVCIPKHLVCNGILNCPNVTMTSTLEVLQQNVRDNLRMLDIVDDNLIKHARYLTDEDAVICQRGKEVEVPYVKLLLIAAGLSLFFTVLLALICRYCCCRSN